MKIFVRSTVMLVAVLAALQGSIAGEPGVVSFVKVLSDKVEDVSSLEAWKKAFIKDGMSDEQKAITVWETVVKFRHQEMPPNEFLMESGHPHDPIRTFNVYGYGQCCCASSNIEGLARYLGLQARGWGIINHSVPEVFHDGAWHMYDASLMTYFPKADGKAASVDELTADVMSFYAKNPELKDNDNKLREFMRDGGWKKGPEILANCKFYDNNGWFMAATHGWYSSMGEYADKAKTFVYEYGYSQGYQVNVQLRQGERLRRNWSNNGLHVNLLEGGAIGCLTKATGKEDLRYTPKYGDLAPGRVGNGKHFYEVPLADGGFRGGALVAENLASKSEDNSGPDVHVKDAAKPATLIMRLPSSYIYLDGAVALGAVIGQGGEIRVSFSDNNGLDWKEVKKISESGSVPIDLKALVYRRYDYRLKVELKGKGTGLDMLMFSNTIQHSQRALPALAQGANTISFSSGAPESTITIEGAIHDNKGKNLRLTDFKPVMNGIMKGDGPLFMEGEKADITLPIATPGEMTRLRFGCHYRARDKTDGWDLQVSFDEGKSFKTVDHAMGPSGGNCKYVTFSDVPPGTKSALVRYSGQQRNTTGILDLRIDADYKEPQGGFSPVKVTYVWDENGSEKTDVHIAKTPEDKWRINCAQKPVMKSVIVERAKSL